MRTIDEVKAFVEAFGFAPSASYEIMGFLLGKGLIEKGEKIKFHYPDHKRENLKFDDFYAWFENDEECPLCGLLNFLQDEQDKAMEEGDEEKSERLAWYMGFLIDALDCEYEEVEKEDEK